MKTQDDLVERAKQLAPKPAPTDVGIIVICVDERGEAGWISTLSTDDALRVLGDILKAPTVTESATVN